MIPPRALIGVCTLREAENIVELVTRLRKTLPHADILVVDDDSSDNTAALVAEIAETDPQVRVIVRKNERGLGSAIRHAMSVAIDEGYDFFLNLDGDLSHDPNELKRLHDRALASPPVDVVIGSRYVQDGAIVGWPIHRKMMSRAVNRFATMCLRLPVKDCSGAMRCYRTEALVKMGMDNVNDDGYSVLEELLVMLHRQGSEMAEVPITFTDRRRGESKLTFREALRSMFHMLALALR